LPNQENQATRQNFNRMTRTALAAKSIARVGNPAVHPRGTKPGNHSNQAENIRRLRVD
jgi:hypothetical protein